MQIIPVIDLLGGTVVHAIGGQREHYQPLVSEIAESSQPADVAAGLRRLGFARVYVADLDAIQYGKRNDASLATIEASGLAVWLDTGVGDVSDLPKSTDDIVVGLETLASVQALGELLSAVGPDRVLLSLDHRHGVPITKIPEWGDVTISQVAREMLQLGGRRFIDLDLTSVGSGCGPQGRGLAAEIREKQPAAFVAMGGGIRNVDDVHEMARRGYDAVLVGTALHDGSIGRDELQPFV